MINLPEGFDGVALVADLFGTAAPFVGIAFIIGCGMMIVNLLKDHF